MRLICVGVNESHRRRCLRNIFELIRISIVYYLYEAVFFSSRIVSFYPLVQSEACEFSKKFILRHASFHASQRITPALVYLQARTTQVKRGGAVYIFIFTTRSAK